MYHANTPIFRNDIICEGCKLKIASPPEKYDVFSFIISYTSPQQSSLTVS